MGCYQNFYAKDGNGNALPFNVLFRLYDSNGVRVPTPEIEPGITVTMWLDEGTTYEATPSNVDGFNNSGAISFVACNSGVTFVYTPIPPGNGFTIRTSLGLATKTVLVAHVVKMPFIGLVGPDPDLWYWPQAFGYVGGKWVMTDPATTYRVEVGSIFETIPSFNKTYGTGSFADGIHCVVLAEGEGGVGTLIFKGSDVFQLFKDSPTEIYLSSTSTDVLTEAIMGPVCDFFGIPRGSACTSFWAEFYDPVYIANYVSIMRTGKDTLGNSRELSGFDHIALPFAVLGSLPGLSLLPFGALVTKGLGTAAKFSDEAVQFMLGFSMDATNKISSKDTWYFLDAIGQVTEDHATEIVNALTAGDTSLANTLLRKYAGESKGWWDYHKLNDLLKDALPTDAYNWLRTQIGLTEIGAGITTKIAKQTTLSADDVAKLASAAEDSEVLIESAEITSKLAKRVVLMAEMGQMDDAWEGALALSMICKNEPEIVRVMTPSQIEDLRKGLLEGFDEAEVDKFINDALRPAGRLVTEYYPKLVKFLGGVGDITKPDIENIFTLGSDSPEDVISILDEFSAIDRRNLIIKLNDGTYRQTLGNMFDLTLSQQSFVPFNKLDGVISSNCRIGLKALDSVDPAKMADIPHAAQEIAGNTQNIVDTGVSGAEDALFGSGKTVADEIVDVADEFVDEATSNWVPKGKAYAKARYDKTWNWFSNLSKADSEKAILAMTAAALGFVATVIYGIYQLSDTENISPLYEYRTARIEESYWVCNNAKTANLFDELAAALVIFRKDVTNAEKWIEDNHAALEGEETYEEFRRYIELKRIQIGIFEDSLHDIGATGFIKCTSNTTFFYVDLDDTPAGFAYNTKMVLLKGIPIGSHTVKIYKEGYTPESCKKTVNIVDGGTEEFDCYLTKIGACSPVTNVKIYIDPLSPIKDQTVSFNGSASSDDPITLWEWKFGDGFTATGQAVTHPYGSAGIYKVELKVTNDCGEYATTTRNVTVSEEEPPTESTTLQIQTPIGEDGNEIPRYWEIEIWVDGKDTVCNPPKTLTFGTNVFCDCTSPWNLVPCELGQHTITLKKYGYDDKSISVYLRKDEPKTWSSPVMVESVTPPPQRTINIVVPVGSTLYVDGKSITGTTTVGRLSTIFNDLRKR